MKHNTTNIDSKILAYLSILNEDIPDFLYDYLEIKEMQRLKHIGLFCGCDYTQLFDCAFFYSRFDHSLGVALIVWHFTHDKKQTIASLLHDVSSPVFSHVVDFLNDDHLLQESTESSNQDIISHSQELLALLNRDDISLEEVLDYKLYPIADNEKPKLSADRLEYMLSTAYVMGRFITLEEIKTIYEDIIITKNEEGIDELSFKTLAVAELFTHNVIDVTKIYLSPEDKLALQLLADILKKMTQAQLVTTEDFYQLTEAQMITLIESSPYQPIYQVFKQLRHVYTSPVYKENKYCIKISVKKRYIDALVNQQRITQISPQAKAWVDDILNDYQEDYIYIDLEDFRDGN